MNVVEIEGSASFRHALALSILTHKKVTISNIRPYDNPPGIKDYEQGLLELLARCMEGCKYTISSTGTTVRFSPGTLSGGEVEFECPTSRGVGYYLEVLIALAPFSKERLELTLWGATHVPTEQGGDPSVDALKDCGLPLLNQFGVIADLDLQIKERGTGPTARGQIFFTCPAVKQLKSVNLRDPGFIKKIRGIGYSIGLSKDMVITATRSAVDVLKTLLNDVRIDTSVRAPKRPPTVKELESSGYGLVLTAEYTKKTHLSAEAHFSQGMSPADLGRMAALRLLHQIKSRPSVPDFLQWVVFLLLPLTPNRNASFVQVGELTESSIRFLRLQHQFLGVKLGINEEVRVLEAKEGDVEKEEGMGEQMLVDGEMENESGFETDGETDSEDDMIVKVKRDQDGEEDSDNEESDEGEGSDESEELDEEMGVLQEDDNGGSDSLTQPTTLTVKHVVVACLGMGMPNFGKQSS
ncbi:putative RNA 3'-terminal phosphate cyclase [Blattamonas nauphoetae]|uniref:RNA 3'-terminal phosphate cyclase n=1 Tax=Blattamonas nauphoetae TaxID=2049346 RepID=A0ABQ9YLE0_9EUKA|nr:putative RNA 3'-terminal phosphate cyclase [Blattamonas nauphoetae]